ncbi:MULTISPECIES: hypothetical protein [Aeromonas]|uniref:Uncharacterized protein n=1 Tax=Aeromonas veronii TaxID=654 RepID=A0A4S5CKN0_AERVE|nr:MULTISPECIES: hypothetical protein [Aeromonas]THJ43666.1 hypothetical protein E8Q35_15280 [Aeromonas veronii]
MIISIYRNNADGRWSQSTAQEELTDARLTEFLLLRIQQHKTRCAFCGFNSPLHQKAIDYNCGVGEFKPIIVCPLCYYSQRLEIAAKHNVGRLILLPGVTQEKLNFIYHGLEGVSIDETSAELKVSVVLGSLRGKLKQSNSGLHAIGPGADSLDVMAESLRNLSDGEYCNRGRALKDVLFWPEQEKLGEISKFWKESIYPALNKLAQQSL